MSEIPFVGDLDGANAYIATLEKERDTEKDRADILLKKLEFARSSGDSARGHVRKLREAVFSTAGDHEQCVLPMEFNRRKDIDCSRCLLFALCAAYKDSE